MQKKSDLIADLAKRADVTQTVAKSVIDALTDSIHENVENGFKLPGIGSLAVVDRAERQGRNPQTGEEMTIPASKNVRFKPGKELRDAVNL